ncbi:MAG: hypothetical protein V8S74_07185 [Lachnospirales bacterium]
MKPSVRMFAKIVFIAILLEVFLFNFKFWTTMTYDPISMSITNVGEGLEKKVITLSFLKVVTILTLKLTESMKRLKMYT